MKKIETDAFYGCKNLEDIDFGHGLERIGENGCRNMFAGCAISKLVLPPQIKKIGIAAFHCCHKLTELVLNDGLEEIETGAFVYCNRLMQVTLPKSIKKIGKVLSYGLLHQMEYMLISKCRYHQFQKILFLVLSSRMYPQMQKQASVFILKTRQKISNSFCLML